MSSSFQILVILFLSSLSLIFALNSKSDDSDSDFCYMIEDCGPKSWGGECQTGSHQSPINLIPSITSTPSKVPLHFSKSGYKSDAFWIGNNGHTVQVSLKQELTSEGLMTGWDLPDEGYVFSQIHFHWGEDDRDGSEHTVDGKHYPIEVHLVHYDAKYSSLEEAATSGDPHGLAVLGIFLSEGSESDENSAFETIVANLPLSFQEHGPEQIFSSSLDLTSFLPGEGSNFFRYLGSLTTPNCTEAVAWTVVEKPIPVKPSLIAKFHDVKDHHGHLMGLNYRPVQPLGDRSVMYMAIDNEYMGSGQNRVKAGTFMIMMAMMIYSLV